MNPPSHRRKSKLVAPAFQLKLVGIFVGLTGTSILLQLFLLGIDLRRVARTLPEGALFEHEIPNIIERSLMFTFGMWLPVIIAVGVLVTHRIAGPVYRFKQHLDGVAHGERMGPCHIRSGDEFQDLCQSLNEGLEKAYRTDPGFLDSEFAANTEPAGGEDSSAETVAEDSEPPREAA